MKSLPVGEAWALKMRAVWLSGWLALGAMLSAAPAHAADKPDAKAVKMGV